MFGYRQLFVTKICLMPPDEITESRHEVPISIRAVSDEQWGILRWLWQAFRQDLASLVEGFPYADGRYQAAVLERYPHAGGAGYLAWRPHPKTGEDAPVGFALVDGLKGERRSIVGFWITPAARRDGVGRVLAMDLLARHPGPWEIAFQQDNLAAGSFWRCVADAAFGRGGWSEAVRAVPDLPDVPPDHFIESR